MHLFTVCLFLTVKNWSNSQTSFSTVANPAQANPWSIHLATIFTAAQLEYEEQAVTEDNKKPDFLFPNGEAYHNMLFPANKLVFLGAKTTCKDRWRQVLNEADRIETKYLFTLQQGISKNQLREMKHEHLKLVVPASYRTSFDKEFQPEIETLASFIEMVKLKQNSNPIYSV